MQDMAQSGAFVFKNRLSEQHVCVFSVDKLITDQTGLIYVPVIAFFTERAWSNLSISVRELKHYSSK